MNIKQHIEAGHYENVSDHVALVRTRAGEKAFIYTTHHHPEWEIVGGIDGESEPFAWQASGRIIHGDRHEDPRDLMPPPPRKVVVTARIECMGPNDAPHLRDYAIRFLGGSNNERIFKEGRVFELTGEYEEPWS